ncbi:aminopeptidase P family protein [Candidatus Bathyarchaeota archaeon]|nr:MAG: aminopeptidase P family protein [Candidatus Bathyarchaeota archaeon]
MPKIFISQKEFERRIETVRQELVKRKLAALYLTSSASVFYLTGYSYIATERPMALIIPVKGKITLFAPLLERDHVPLRTKIIEEVKIYPEYPGEKHPIDYFAEFMKEMKLHNKKIGTDNLAGAAGIWGYEGPPITKRLPKAKFVLAKDIIGKMRMIKSEEEIQLIKESAKWANLAHTLLQEYTAPGMWDVEVSITASYEASLMMRKALGPDYMPVRWGHFPASAGFRGQVGPMSAIPHAIATNKNIQEGDVVVTGAGADVGGYSCELERTMIVGKPNNKQRKFFEIMLKAQEAAFKAFKPGAKCSDVDKAAKKVFLKAGYGKYVLHHTGHGLGLEGHEPPWLDLGDQTILKPGMIFSCEPGIYIPGFAGFRHSDTVLITEDGAEVITYYPRDIESLTIT